MKHVTIILIILLLALLAIGIAYMQYIQPQSVWGLAYLPWTLITILFGSLLNDNYY